jgi:hypothetical protein
MPVTIQYKTTLGTYWNTKDEAFVADALESHPGVYLHRNQVIEIVAALTSKCFFFERTVVPETIQTTTQTTTQTTEDTPNETN